MKYTNAKDLRNTSIPKSRMKGSKLPQYGWAGNFNASKTGQYMNDNAGAISSLANTGAAGITALDQLDGKTSMLGAGASGALKGASMGMAFGPAGALVGAGVGLVGGAVMGHFKSKQEEEAAREEEKQKRMMKDQMRLNNEAQSLAASKAILSTYPTSGVTNAGFAMAYGGKIPEDSASYLAEDQEVIQHAPNDVPDTDQNGNVQRIASDMSKFVGDTHDDASQGIGANNDSDARIYSNRLYVPKDMLSKLKNI